MAAERVAAAMRNWSARGRDTGPRIGNFEQKELAMSATNRLLTGLKRVVRDSEDLLQTTKDAAGEKVDEVRRRLNSGLVVAKQTCRDLEGMAIEGAKAADKTIRAYPYQS